MGLLKELQQNSAGIGLEHKLYKSQSPAIKRSTRNTLELQELIRNGTMSKEMAMFLCTCVKGRLNILVSGGTGAGKTTLVQALSTFIPHEDRNIIGDIRDKDLYKIFQQDNVKPDGFLASGHSSSPRNMIDRLEIIGFLKGVGRPIKAVREQIAQSIDIIVHLSRFNDGTRKITKITEVKGVKGEHIELRNIFSVDSIEGSSY